MTISADLKLTTHIENSVAKGYRMLGFLRSHISKDFDARTRRALYLTTVGYVSDVWFPTSIGNLRTVESLQRRESRFILNYPDISYRDRLNQLDLVPLCYWHEIKDLVFLFKCNAGLYNINISQFVKPKPMTRPTRHSCNLDMSVPLCKTKLFQGSYFNRIPKMWNSLPPTIRGSVSVSSFKIALYKHYKSATNSSFDVNNCRSWKSVCPKCHSAHNITLPRTCCF